MAIKKDKSFGEAGDQVLDAIKASVNYQEDFIPPKSNLIQKRKKQTPDDIIQKRIDAQVKEYQVTAGLTIVQRKILKAKIDAMRTRVYNDGKNYTSDASIAKACKINAASVTAFNNNETCRNALMACTKIYVETIMPDLIANLTIQAKEQYQPNIKLLEIIQQYATRSSVESHNKSLNVNLDMGNTPEAIMKQVIIKLGSANYDRERFQSEIMSLWDNLKAEGAF